MKKHMGLVTVLAVGVLYGQQASDHHSGVVGRGDHAMGFSHEKTTHHFRLSKDGGAIEVEANNAKDLASRDSIRGHLRHIAVMFSAGNFSTPMLIHDQTPPGVPAMQRLKNKITYVFENTDGGGRVRISSRNPEAVKAVHEFLSFQIKDHQTGDPIVPQK